MAVALLPTSRPAGFKKKAVATCKKLLQQLILNKKFLKTLQYRALNH